MQFDQMRIAVRERSYLELLDLTMLVFRAHAAPILGLALLGILPFALLNYFLLDATELAKLDYDVEYIPGLYIFLYIVLLTWELPMATSLVTLYLGQVMFQDRPDWRRLRRDFFNSLFQMIVIQGILRGMFLVLFFVFHVAAPYMNEVILLERNPLFAGRSHHISTFRRATRLHEFALGDLFGRWLASLLFGALWVLALWKTLIWCRQVFTGQMFVDEYAYTIIYPVAIWFVVTYFAVARYLCYLDLRIRTEGWEVELLLRAEAAKLARQAAA